MAILSEFLHSDACEGRGIYSQKVFVMVLFCFVYFAINAYVLGIKALCICYGFIHLVISAWFLRNKTCVLFMVLF